MKIIDGVRYYSSETSEYADALCAEGERLAQERDSLRPIWFFASHANTGDLSAVEPDGTRHYVKRGDMNSLEGQALLNAMVRDLT